MRKISADIIYPVTVSPVENGVVIVNENGSIETISSRSEFDPAELEIHSGVIVPGFINTHCHLELSHMKGKIQTGTGLISFIGQVVKQRDAEAEVILEAIENAAKEMYGSGIVAVGDISNTTDSFPQKLKGNLHYYTFVEFFDLFQEGEANKYYERYSEVYDALPETPMLKKSKVPHAPYSVSKVLFDLLRAEKGKTISIHNQETPPENELFEKNTGGFIDFYNGFSLSPPAIPLLNKTSIHYALEYLTPENKNLFVHNTLSQREDIAAAHEKLSRDNCFWATCPNANLYIEGRLPDYYAFIRERANMTIGTDSLTSNWQLNLLEEMKTIFKYYPEFDFETVLSWATLNGAKALGWENELGSFDKGKKPGLVLIENMENGKLTSRSISKRIA